MVRECRSSDEFDQVQRENWHEFYSESFDRCIIMVYIRGYAALSHMKEKKTSSIRSMFRCAKRHIGSLMIQLADMHFSMPFSVFAVEELVSNREKNETMAFGLHSSKGFLCGFG